MIDARSLTALADKARRSHELLRSRESVAQALVLPLLRELGYPIADPREVRCGEALALGEGESVSADIAIFAADAPQPRMIVDVRPHGADLWARSPLARAIGRVAGLRFLVVTDGASYHLYADTAEAGVIDDAPFFAFSLDADPEARAATLEVLGRLARDGFDVEFLVTRAEDESLRRALSRRLSAALRAPTDDPEFVRWLSEGVYEGKRTRPVLDRLSRIAGEAVMPAVLGVLGDEYLDGLRRRLTALSEAAGREAASRPSGPGPGRASEPPVVAMIREICRRAGADPAEIVWRETTNYIGVGFRHTSRWFLRWFDGSRRRALTTLVSVDEARALAPFEVEGAPQSFGVSRVLLDAPEQVWALEALIKRSLDLCRHGEQLALADSA
ncbi:MAG: hypothetical protein R3B09_03455 [Nannocystaceae bacterium]